MAVDDLEQANATEPEPAQGGTLRGANCELACGKGAGRAARGAPRIIRIRWQSLALAALLALSGCDSPSSETIRFTQGSSVVEVTFLGEVPDDALFGAGASLLDQIRPLDEQGRRRGQVHSARPGWLHFEYRIDRDRHEVWVAKQPLLNDVSWDDVARAGAVSGDGSAVTVGFKPVPQLARAKDAQGGEYTVRLPTCGHSTLADLSEWNLLIGAVHRGDMDFVGERYGWIHRPYGNEDLKVGYHGSLSWCQESFGDDRVARGYFFVSRFHADSRGLRTSRIHWRPVLERPAADKAVSSPTSAAGPGMALTWSPSGRVGYGGSIDNAALFGRDVGIGDLVPVEGGNYVDDGKPPWLRFMYEGKTLLVAAKPVKHSVSWDAIAAAGAATGDGSLVRVGWRFFRQNAEVTARDGTRYRVRLIDCGKATLDIGSEWNSLIGGVHRGDGDFWAYPRGVYGWLPRAFENEEIGVGGTLGNATWCRNRLEIDGKSHGVNRGYMTVSRYHATETAFTGSGFGWRPVLEALR